MENQNEPGINIDGEVGRLLRLLGGFYELSNFGPRSQMMAEFDKMVAAENSVLDQYTDMLAEEERRLFKEPNLEEEIGHVIRLMTVYAALAHCAEAQRADTAAEKLFHMCWAYTDLGRCRGMMAGEVVGRLGAIKMRAKQGAAGRHKETHAIKQQVFNWLAENIAQFKTNTAAADAVRKVAPLTHDTAIGYVREFKKNGPDK